MSLPTIVVTGRDRPHEVGFLLLGLLLGIVYTLGVTPPNSIMALLPTWQIYTWFGLLLISSLVGIIGCFWYGVTEIGLRLELIGMIFQSCATLLYATSLFYYANWSALGTGSIVAVWTFSNLWRAVQIKRYFRHGD